MSEQSQWAPSLRIAVHLLLAGVAFGVGWWLWSISDREWWMFGIYGAIFALGGAIRLGQAFLEVINILIRRRRMAKYGSQGAAPKADRMAGEDDLRDRGLLK
ncbi:MAG: hypothetical protein AAF441_17370 [Pseudomonadota bacterium]